LTEFFQGLLPWDIDRFTLTQFNAYMTFRNDAIKAAEKASKSQRS